MDRTSQFTGGELWNLHTLRVKDAVSSVSRSDGHGLGDSRSIMGCGGIINPAGGSSEPLGSCLTTDETKRLSRSIRRFQKNICIILFGHMTTGEETRMLAE